ncbi:DegV family protein [Clostridium sp. YIM B02515]|uniref:DegV family protein n=1 Tax=Clostridium rhizosphaerae TaxID=2803861 RepID=A0ABS1T7P0_9CLOT|nr:DegV family protein [Clostridium rhizosphaerae]
MEKIKIITDSTADLPLEIIRKYDIEVIPLTVHFGDESYRDGIDIDIKEFLNKIKISEEFPTTSQINPNMFYDCYNKYLKEGYKILSIHLSSKLSGTYQSACIAKNMLESDDIIIIDSLNVTSGLGILVLKACRLIEEGNSLIEVEREIKGLIPHIRSALAFESLENLVKGGRLSKTAGTIGSILGIKPIIEIRDGELVVKDKVRGTKKAIKNILKYLEGYGIKSGEPCMILQAENKEIRDALKENMLERKKEFIECEVGCVVGTHSGIGACGIFFIENH